MSDLWLSESAWAAHLVGFVGIGLMLVALVYSLRKRKLVIRFWRMNRWLTLHHWAGFLGGILVFVHTLGNMSGLGWLSMVMLTVVLGSSSLYFLERRSRGPLMEATAKLAQDRISPEQE